MRSPSGGTRPRTTLGVEQLEDRTVPTTYHELYTASLYHRELYRYVDGGGLNYWSSVALSNRGAAAWGIGTSAEAVGVEINRVYTFALGRSASSADRAYWTNAIRSGATLGVVQALIWGSDEALRRTNATTNAFTYLNNVYQFFLGRGIDQASVNFWVGRSNAGAKASEICYAIYASGEGVGRQIDVSYQFNLGRNPSNGEKSYWANTLGTSYGRLALAAGVLGSGEFWNKVQNYGAAVPSGVNVNDPNALAANFLSRLSSVSGGTPGGGDGGTPPTTGATVPSYARGAWFEDTSDVPGLVPRWTISVNATSGDVIAITPASGNTSGVLVGNGTFTVKSVTPTSFGVTFFADVTGTFLSPDGNYLTRVTMQFDSNTAGTVANASFFDPQGNFIDNTSIRIRMVRA